MKSEHIFGQTRPDNIQESNPYNIPTTDNNIRAPLVSLEVLYERMPETTGCESCEKTNGENAYWCCKTISPSMYYVEFLYVWDKVQKLNKDKRLNVVLRAIKNYLSSDDSKGCIFYDDGCTVYDRRPLACRCYGVVPSKKWDERVAVIKERYKDCEVSDNFKRKLTQCGLVSNVDGSKSLADRDEQDYFEHTAKCESRIGVPPNTILEHDGPKGSYRMFHDHIMLEFIDTAALAKLTQIKTQLPKQEDIDAFAEVLFDTIKENLEGSQ